MSHLRSALLSSLLLATLPAAAAEEDFSPVQKDVWALEEAYTRYVEAENLEAYVDLWHPDFVAWPKGLEKPTGRETLEKFIRDFFDGYEPSFYRVEPMAVEVHGKVAIVHYVSTWEARDAEGAKVGSTDRITHVWVKKRGKWKLIGGTSAAHGGSSPQ